MAKIPVSKGGTLYIVATPIGNLEDISLRALNILRTVDVIAAEDTRHSQHLLSHYGISKKLMSYHQFNESQRLEQFLQFLQAGESIALISDAGTPLISDPGYGLVKALRAAKVKIVAIPGPCAAVAALAVSGLPTDCFMFVGFLPRKPGLRLQRLTELEKLTPTLIFYESVHRIISTLESMLAIFGTQRHAVILRELTKTFESYYQGNLSELIQYFQEHSDEIRGEFVILLAGKPEEKLQELTEDIKKTLGILLEELPVKQAVQLTAKICDANKNQVYQMALDIKN